MNMIIIIIIITIIVVQLRILRETLHVYRNYMCNIYLCTYLLCVVCRRLVVAVVRYNHYKKHCLLFI